MFKVVKHPTFKRTVTIHVPDESAEGSHVETLTVIFRVVRKHEAPDIDTADGSIEFLNAAIMRLDDLVDEAGEPIADSPQVRAALFELPYVRLGLGAAYFAGLNEVKLGN